MFTLMLSSGGPIDSVGVAHAATLPPPSTGRSSRVCDIGGATSFAKAFRDFRKDLQDFSSRRNDARERGTRCPGRAASALAGHTGRDARCRTGGARSPGRAAAGSVRRRPRRGGARRRSRSAASRTSPAYRCWRAPARLDRPRAGPASRARSVAARLSGHHRGQQWAHALPIRRIEPQCAIEHARGLVAVFETPETRAIAR